MIEPRIEIVLPAKPMAATLRFFREELGFRLESITPADNPAIAVLVGGGARVQLRSDYDGAPGRLMITADTNGASATRRAPNGTEIVFAQRQAARDLTAPAQSPVITTRADNDAWVTGRADMLYRDLIPGRMGGQLIASHIRIPDGGLVADDVHFHDIRFQAIYCYRGWARLVYEDQGEPFVLHAGDCVLQPPQIRHRVLEASEGLEVIEIGSPADHLTTLDHQLELPNSSAHPQRDFRGQRFHVHRQAKATQRTDAATDWQVTDLGMAAATDQLADMQVIHANATATCQHDRMCFLFVLTGSCRITVADAPATPLHESDSATVPGEVAYTIDECQDETQLLRVIL